MTAVSPLSRVPRVRRVRVTGAPLSADSNPGYLVIYVLPSSRCWGRVLS